MATTLGYFVNGGFEIFWASLLFAQSLGRPELKLPVAVTLAVVVGAYCRIGGYRSNATVDRPHNILGVASLATLVWFVTYSLRIDGAFQHASMFFTAGAALYVIISALMWYGVVRPPAKVLDSLSLLYALSACGTVLYLISQSAQSPELQMLVAHAPIPWFLIVSTVTFQVFFNVVDMQNWQQIAANADLNDHRDIMSAIVRASLYLLWFLPWGCGFLPWGASFLAAH